MRLACTRPHGTSRRSATAGTRRTWRLRTCSTGADWSPTSTMGRRSSRSTGAPRGFSFHTCTSGSPRSGCADSRSWRMTRPAFGRPTGTISAEIPGKRNATQETERASVAHPVAFSGGTGDRGGNAAREDDPARRPGLAKTPARPARRRTTHGGGRIPGTAQLLDRIAARGGRYRAHGRAPRGRRGLDVPDRRVANGRPNRVAWACRRVLHVDRGAGRPDCACRRGQRRRAAHGDGPASRRAGESHPDAPPLLVAHGGRRHLPRRACTPRGARGRPGGDAHIHPQYACRLAGLHAADRSRDARRGPERTRRTAARVHLWADADGRVDRHSARFARARTQTDMDGAIRPYRLMTMTKALH